MESFTAMDSLHTARIDSHDTAASEAEVVSPLLGTVIASSVSSATPPLPAPLHQAIRNVGGWLTSSIGLFGVLIGIGFLVDTASRDRLGYEVVADMSPTRLMSLAGQFLAAVVEDCTQIVFSTAGLSLFAVMVFVLIGTRILRAASPPLNRWIQDAWRVLVLSAAVAVSLCVLLTVSVPALYVRDLLHRNLQGHLLPPPGPSKPANMGQVQSTVRDQICARVNVVLGDTPVGLAISRGYPNCTRQAWFEDDRQPQSRANARIVARFSLAALCTAGMIVLLLAVSSGPSGRTTGAVDDVGPRTPPSWVVKTERALSPVAFALTLLNLLLLPTVFGRTRQTTDVPVADVTYQTAEGGLRTQNLFLLGQSAADFVAFDPDSDVVYVLPRSSIRRAAVSRRQDILQSHFSYVLAKLPPLPSSAEASP